MKKQLLLAALAGGALVNQVSGQILYSETFNGLTLSSGGSGSSAFKYSDVPTAMFTINNGNKTMVTSQSGTSTNAPFYAAGQNQKAWLAYKAAGATDTVAVSSSWVTPAGSVDMWMITPTISGIDNTTVLTWNAAAPDGSFPDGYEVYVTTNTTGTPTVSDFTSPNKLFSIASENNAWTSRGVSLAAYNGQSIRVAFRNNSNDMYQLWLDDIVVQKLANALDISANSLDLYQYTVIGSSSSIKANVSSLGYQNVSSITMNYQVGSATPVSQTFNISPTLGYSGNTDLTFSTSYVGSTAGTYPVKVWVSQVNGSADAVNTNDTVTGSITVLSSKPAKKVLMEENTGAWCGWCPDGYTRLSALLSSNPNVIGASIHNADNMSTTEGDAVQSLYVQGFPSGFVDRVFYEDLGAMDIDRGTWATKAGIRQNDVVPCTVTLLNKNYNASTRTLSITVQADFVGAVSGDFRLNCYIVENNIFGPYLAGNGWTQHSYLNTTTSSPYYGKGSDLSNGDYKHMHVVNKMLGGSWGDAGIIPATTTAGGSYQKTYVYTLPATPANVQRYIADNTYIVGLVQEYKSDALHRNVLNAAEDKLNSNAETVGINEVTSQIAGVKVFPNPATNFSSISVDLLENSDLTVNVINAMGQIVYSQAVSNAAAGNHVIDLNSENWASGIYNINIATAKGAISRKLTVTK